MFQGRKKPIPMPGSTEGKNPVSFLNEIRGVVEYVLLGQYGNCEVGKILNIQLKICVIVIIFLNIFFMPRFFFLQQANYSFTMGCNIDGVPYSGSGKTKKVIFI